MKETTLSPTANSSLRLRSFFERIERLEEEKKSLTQDIKEIFAEAKAEGYDPKVMRKVLALRAMDPHERDEMEALVDLYRTAAGI